MKILTTITLLYFTLTSLLLVGQDDFQITYQAIDTVGQLTWTTINEPTKTTFTIEQYRWNNWIEVGEVDGKGKAKNKYFFKITSFHSRLNIFRINTGTLTSDTIKYISKIPEGRDLPTKVDKELSLDSETAYEIYDSSGALKLKGTAKTVDVSSLTKGIYYLKTTNRTEQFIKK